MATRSGPTRSSFGASRSRTRNFSVVENGTSTVDGVAEIGRPASLSGNNSIRTVRSLTSLMMSSALVSANRTEMFAAIASGVPEIRPLRNRIIVESLHDSEIAHWVHEPPAEGARATSPAARRPFGTVGKNDKSGQFGRAAGGVARAPQHRFMESILDIRRSPAECTRITC